jgi:ribonuclease R
VPARTVGNEYFRHHEDRRALVGDDSGETYRLGDKITVRLVEAAPVAGALRFEILSEGRYEASRQRRSPRPTQGNRARGRGKKGRR